MYPFILKIPLIQIKMHSKKISDLLVHPQQGNQPQQHQEQHQSTKVPGQERITIVEDVLLHRNDDHHQQQTSTDTEKNSHPWVVSFKEAKICKWVQRQCTAMDNRYAFQMGVAFTLAALLVIIGPVSQIFPNAFWVGVSVVTVLDNTVGGFLNLSIQRLIGTLIGGGSSIVVMTITRAIFHPRWEWDAALVLGFLMFIQVFFIAKLKMMPNMSYAGSIGLLTTCIILLSGYPNLIHDRLSYAAELGAWRTLNLIIGIVISLLVSLFVFPLKASSVMRKNLGKALEDAADLYKKSSEYYLDFSGHTTTAVDESLASNIARRLPAEMMEEANAHQLSITDILTRTFSTQPPEVSVDMQNQIRQQIDEVNRFWTHDSITNISNQAFGVLAKLQAEATRLRNVSNEYYFQIIFHIFGGGRDRCKRDMRRAKRYNEAIEAMKRVVWPLVSFRLLMPLINLSQSTNRLDELVGARSGGSPASQDTITLQERITPTKETLESFHDSLTVMLRLGKILKNHRKPLSAFPDDWLEIDRMVTAGNLHIQRELKLIIKVAMYTDNTDGLKLLSYYGFLVRCSMIWDGLKTVVEKLSPLNGSLSRASSMGVGTPLPNREYVNPAE
ncbi:aluminum activated malate transporter-domain-containing protein [Parasitella parasitica]|nr:aluminum activated malate transporter-domain-containing protein [Parasitella parasitica]